MFRRIRWKLLATYLIVVSSALVFLGVHLARQFEIVLTEPLAVDLDAQVRHVRWVVAWGTVVALLIATGVGLLLARSIAAPVQQMQVVAGRLAAGRLSERVPVQTRDELGDLARSLNYMASELERIDSMRREFVADAAHELRTPVANLAVAVEALKAVLKQHPDRAAPVAGDIEREVARLRRLVEDLLDLSLVDAGQVQLHLTTVSPADVLRRAVRPFALRGEPARIALNVDVPPRLPPVRADADRTIQVLTNLLDNAFKHTPPGGAITVGAMERRGHVLLSVRDTGPGIPASELANIFDRFYKSDKARTGGGGGAGLGLAIAKRLVEAQGGIIMVESTPGKGTRFAIALPKAG